MLLAVSGGADSRALLVASAALSVELGVTFVVGTIDHGLRAEAAQEVEEVFQLSRLLGLEAFVERVSLERGPGLEQRARLLREAALTRIRAASGCEAIGTAHTASDQAETLLMRLIRGTSLRGARSILARKGPFVRPLLQVTAAETRAFLKSSGHWWAEDPMNEDPQFLRVRLRRSVLPALRAAAGFEVDHPLARFAALAAEDEALLEELADAAMQRCVLSEGGGLAIAELRSLQTPLLRRVLARFFREQELRVDAAHLDGALEAVRRGGRIGLSRGAQLETAGGRLRITRSKGEGPSSSSELELTAGQLALHPVSGWRFLLASPELPVESADASVPLSTARVCVRARRPGDRVQLRSGHSKKLQDLLVDARVPRELRDAVPLVEVEGRILWVPGITPPPTSLDAGGGAFMLLHAFAPGASGVEAGRSL